MESRQGFVVEHSLRNVIHDKHLLNSNPVVITSLTDIASEVLDSSSYTNLHVSTESLSMALAKEKDLPWVVLDTTSQQMAQRGAKSWLNYLAAKDVNPAKGGRLLFELFKQQDSSAPSLSEMFLGEVDKKSKKKQGSEKRAVKKQRLQRLEDNCLLICNYINLPTREAKAHLLLEEMHLGLLFATAFVSNGKKCQNVVEIDVKGRPLPSRSDSGATQG
eukprot:tig00001164_g7417.t1